VSTPIFLESKEGEEKEKKMEGARRDGGGEILTLFLGPPD